VPSFGSVAIAFSIEAQSVPVLRSLGTTTSNVTHDQPAATELGDRIVVVRQRTLVQVGTPRTMTSSHPAASSSNSSAPPRNDAVALDLAELIEPPFRVEPPALLLHPRFPDQDAGDLVTCRVPIGASGGPLRFVAGGCNLLCAFEGGFPVDVRS